MNFINKGIEFIVFFVIIYILYYFTTVKKYKKNNKFIPSEVGLIVAKHNIDIKKIDLYKMLKTGSLVTSLILSFSIVLTSIFIKNVVLSLLYALVLSLVLAMIIYNFIGIYYKKRESKK